MNNFNLDIENNFFFLMKLDEDVRVLLQRFDAETSDETETKSTFSF